MNFASFPIWGLFQTLFENHLEMFISSVAQCEHFKVDCFTVLDQESCSLCSAS